jgi:arylsulfatase A-like enzyme
LPHENAAAGPQPGAAAVAVEPERVQRLASAGVEFREVSAAGETRRARTLTPSEPTRICVPSAPGAERVVSLGLRTDVGGVSARVERPGDEPVEAALGTRWSDLRISVPSEAGCLGLTIMGPAGAPVAASLPLLEQAGPRRPWVVLYVVDTLRFDATPFGGAPAEVAPAFAAFARDAVLYRRAFSVTSWTRPAVATLLTGLGPVHHGVYDRQDRLAADLPRLPQRLARAGWATAAVSTNPNILPLWGFLTGFDRFVDVDAHGWIRRSGLAALGATVDAILTESARGPLFLYVHDNGPHAPWTPPAAARQRFGAPPAGHPAEELGSVDDPESVRDARRRLYQASIRDTSDRFEALLTRLRELGRYDAALIVLVGDHGEEFGDHGDVSHGRTLYQEQLHVPLAVKLPGNAGAGAVVEDAVTTADVVPTILRALGLATGAGSGAVGLPIPGDDARELAPIFAELDLAGHRAESVVEWPWKYLDQGGEGERLFDLAADPGETRDAKSSAPDVIARLRAAARARRVAARRGLWLDCAAGASRARVVLDLELGSSVADSEPVGLEPGDRVTPSAGGLRVSWVLRPAESFSALELLDVRAQAQSQPDRDRVRFPGTPSSELRVRSSGDPLWLESPSGEALPLDGTAIPLDRLAASGPRIGAPTGGGDVPVCRLTHRAPRGDRLPEEAMDESLRERLRALGYLEEP